MLHNFRKYAGLERKAEIYGGQESDSLAAHTFGLHLTALVLMNAQTDDAESAVATLCWIARGCGVRSAGDPQQMKLLAASDHQAVPRNNGGGLTREIAAFPGESTFANLLWYGSITNIDAAVAFSHLSVIDRLLIVLEATMRRSFVDAGNVVTRRPGDDPLAFSGDDIVVGDPGSSGVPDLNIMTQRGQCEA